MLAAKVSARAGCGKSARPVRRGERSVVRHLSYSTAAKVADINSDVGATRCAERVRQLGGESPPPNLMEVKG
jgi:hypothetical protein